MGYWSGAVNYKRVNFENVGKKVINGNIINLVKFKKYGNNKD